MEDDYQTYCSQKIYAQQLLTGIKGDKLKAVLHRSIQALTFLNHERQTNVGSATLISKDLIFTAAHHIYDRKMQYENTNFKIYIGADGLAKRSQDVERWIYPDEYKSCADSQRLKFDYALMKLKQPIQQDKYPSLSLLCQQCLKQNNNTSIEVYGFPLLQDNFKPVDQNGQIIKLCQYGLSRQDCIVDIDVHSSRIDYKISTGPGQSGCPVAIGDSIIAVHLGGESCQFNVGRIVDSALINNLVRWSMELKSQPFKIQKEIKCQHAEINTLQPSKGFYLAEAQEKLRIITKSKRQKIGLINEGNTSFMNSSIQCISHIQELARYFMSKKYIEEINPTNPLGTKGEIATTFGKAIQRLWCETQPSISITQLRKAIQRFSPMFSGYNQHDSSQFINYLLDALHEDVNRVKKKPYVVTKEYDGRPDQIVASQAWEDFLKRNQSIIVDLFYGQHKSIMNCPKCQFQSIEFDPFIILSLPLTGSKDIKQSISHSSDTKIENCFKLFTKPVVLDEGNAWYCPKCKEFVLAKRQMLIYKAPKILILSLKRFMPKENSFLKDTSFINYPISGLDLSSYLIHTGLPFQAQGKAGKPIYDLFSVCNHVGTGKGHYSAYCKDMIDEEWYLFDDSHVSKVKNNTQVVSSAGYILFYRRRE